MFSSVPVGLAQNVSATSPAAQPLPRSASTQTYAPDLVAAGRTRFAAACGFCHGPEATGGSSGPDLTRSAVVAADEHGDRIGALVRTGRATAGMPAFPALSDADLAAIAAFIHEQKTKAEAETGDRRSVEPEDLVTGNARAGRRYFATACASCHSADGDLAGVASRYEGLDLLRNMLYPRGPRPTATATVTTRDGATVTGTLAYRDEFTIALTTAAGEYRSWPVDRVRLEIRDPLQAHFEQLGRYTDATMHDVLAYLQTLRQDTAR
ncbi:MAG TPA: c-type cytochrome [Gammaproteobacteria bacterium]|nr:c-type cytochrome [Gammaproteobacteria bacterium]